MLVADSAQDVFLRDYALSLGDDIDQLRIFIPWPDPLFAKELSPSQLSDLHIVHLALDRRSTFLINPRKALFEELHFFLGLYLFHLLLDRFLIRNSF